MTTKKKVKKLELHTINTLIKLLKSAKFILKPLSGHIPKLFFRDADVFDSKTPLAK